MQITSEILQRWLATEPDGPDREARAARWRARLADPRRARWRAALSGDQVRGLTWLFDTGPDSLGIATPRTRGAPIDACVAALIDECVAVARAEGVGRLGLRIPVDRVSTALTDAIARTDGAEIGGRIEFKTPMDALPDEGASPLRWQPAPGLQRAAELLERVSRDSCDGLEPGEDPREVIASWLADTELTTDPDAVLHVGTLEGQDVALVCARVNPDDGWSTLTFMGLAPRARGRGLGHAVQRHGIAMLRAQGGRLYHGGTSLDNAAMRACFVRQGCAEHARFRQFRWTP